MLLITSVLGAGLIPGASTSIAADEATPDSEALPVVAADPFPADIPAAGTTIGDPDAPVDVVVWGDYTCPGCGRFARETLPQLIAEFIAPGDARLTYRDYAFRGQEAIRAAEAAACAADQGAFWPFHTTLFRNHHGPGSFADDRLLDMARALTLDIGLFGSCLESGAKRGAVERSIAEARSRGIDSVPTVFVSGQEVEAWDDVNVVRDAIARALDLATRQPDRAATPPQATPPAPTVVGLELVFEMRPPGAASIDSQSAVAVRATLERRMDALGLTGGVWRRAGNQVLVRVDATGNPERVARALAAPTSLTLEIIDPQGRYLPPGTIVTTTLDAPARSVGQGTATPVTAGDAAPSGGPVFETIVSGADLRDVEAVPGNDGVTPAVRFDLRGDGVLRLYDYTSTHVGEPMSIVIDKRVVFSPTITAAISGQGIIEGLSPEEVAGLVAQFDEGALAVHLELVETRTIAVLSAAATPAP